MNKTKTFFFTIFVITAVYSPYHQPVLLCPPHTTSQYYYVLPIPPASITMSSPYHQPVLLCPPHATSQYYYVLPIPPTSITMSSPCHQPVLLCPPLAISQKIAMVSPYFESANALFSPQHQPTVIALYSRYQQPKFAMSSQYHQELHGGHSMCCRLPAHPQNHSQVYC